MYMKTKKAQSSVEFMIIFAMLLLVMVLAVFIGGKKSTEIVTIETGLEIQSLLDRIVGKINTVYIEGDGFSTEMYMPENIMGMNYTVNVTSNIVFITRNNFTYSKMLLTENVTGIIDPGVSILKNVNGVVEVS